MVELCGRPFSSIERRPCNISGRVGVNLRDKRIHEVVRVHRRVVAAVRMMMRGSTSKGGLHAVANNGFAISFASVYFVHWQGDSIAGGPLPKENSGVLLGIVIYVIFIGAAPVLALYAAAVAATAATAAVPRRG